MWNNYCETSFSVLFAAFAVSGIFSILKVKNLKSRTVEGVSISVGEGAVEEAEKMVVFRMYKSTRQPLRREAAIGVFIIRCTELDRMSRSCVGIRMGGCGIQKDADRRIDVYRTYRNIIERRTCT